MTSLAGTTPLTASVEVIDTPNNRTLWFQLPEALSPYLFTKGYIGIDGCSLTLGEVRGSLACVHLIPETLSRTTLGTRQIGERVNIEIDPQTQVIVDTVARLLAARGVVRTAAETETTSAHAAAVAVEAVAFWAAPARFGADTSIPASAASATAAHPGVPAKV